MTLQTFINAQEQLDNNSREAVSVSFPFREEDGKIYDAAGTQIIFQQSGINYLAGKLSGDRQQFRRLWVDGKFEDLVREINAAYDMMVAESDGKDFELNMLVYNGKAVGFTKEYVFIESQDILDSIEEAGLAKQVDFSKIDDRKFRVWINLSSTKDDPVNEWSAGVRITNGHSGHVSLNYQSYIKVSGYEASIPLHGRHRHISGVDDLVATLTEVVGLIGEINFDMELRAVDADTALELLTDEFPDPTRNMEKIIDALEVGISDGDIENAFDLLHTIGSFINQRGYRSPAKKLGDIIVKNFTSYGASL